MNLGTKITKDIYFENWLLGKETEKERKNKQEHFEFSNNSGRKDKQKRYWNCFGKVDDDGDDDDDDDDDGDDDENYHFDDNDDTFQTNRSLACNPNSIDGFMSAWLQSGQDIKTVISKVVIMM